MQSSRVDNRLEIRIPESVARFVALQESRIANINLL